VHDAVAGAKDIASLPARRCRDRGHGGPREPGQSFVVTTTTEFRWLATDMAGNQTSGRATFEIK